MTDVNARSLQARRYSTTSFHQGRTASGGRAAPSSFIQALDLHSTTRLNFPPALSSLRMHVLSYLSDLETRLALLDFKSRSGSEQSSRLRRPLSPQHPTSSVLEETSESFVPLQESVGVTRPQDDSEVDDIALDSDDVATFIKQGFELLQTIRAEVCSHLPEVEFDFDFDSLPAVALQKRDALRNRLNDLGIGIQMNINAHQLADQFHDRLDQLKSSAADKFDFEKMHAHMPVMPSMPTMPSMPSMDFLRSRLSELKPGVAIAMANAKDPLSYVPRLKAHLASLHAHMQDPPSAVRSTCTFPLPNGIMPPKIVTDILADLLEEDTEEAIQADMQKEKEAVETMHVQVLRALERSNHGRRLIKYDELPVKWRNNEFVQHGYRFIPPSDWPALVFSIFEFHNETSNIHTHLIPLITVLPILWSFAVAHLVPASFMALLPPSSTSAAVLSLSSLTQTLSWIFAHISISIPTLLPHDGNLDTLPAAFFAFSAACCLLSSVIWHVANGCSDPVIMESAARGDYVGIGWLISASVQNVVFYGFKYKPTELRLYTALCMMTGLAGSIVPFMSWFDERRNKKWRILFFLSLCFASLLPLAHLSIAKGPINTFFFLIPTIQPCVFYVIGLCFYATHFPECCFAKHGRRFDIACSHTLWHVFIILAIRSHYVGLSSLKAKSETFSCGLQ